MSNLPAGYGSSLIKEFISIYTTSVAWKPSDEPFQPRAIGLSLVGHPQSAPVRLFQRPGPERFRWVRMPALSTTRRLVVVCLLTNELLSNSQLFP